MRITKVKYIDKDGELRIHWEVEEDGGIARSELISRDRPHPDFFTTLGQLVDHVVKLLELPITYGEDMQIRGVSITYDDDGRMGAVITALKPVECSAAPVVLNTPHIACLADYDHVLELHVESLINQATRFIRGDRAQQRLFKDEAA